MDEFVKTAQTAVQNRLASAFLSGGVYDMIDQLHDEVTPPKKKKTPMDELLIQISVAIKPMVEAFKKFGQAIAEAIGESCLPVLRDSWKALTGRDVLWNRLAHYVPERLWDRFPSQVDAVLNFIVDHWPVKWLPEVNYKKDELR